MDTFEKIVCRVAFGLLFGGLLLSVAVSQGGAKEASQGRQGSLAQNPKVSAADQQFIKEAADGGLAEVELGKLAVRKAAHQQVKSFGQRMINDHGKSNDQLAKLAADKGVVLSRQPGDENKATQDRLAKLSGDQFDNAYMAEMLKDHKQDIAEFRHESKAADDTDVKNFVTKTLPTLQNHLKQAESVAPDLKAQRKAAQKPSPAIAQSHQSQTGSNRRSPGSR
jgi:putative membrane protein